MKCYENDVYRGTMRFLRICIYVYTSILYSEILFDFIHISRVKKKSDAIIKKKFFMCNEV